MSDKNVNWKKLYVLLLLFLALLVFLFYRLTQHYS